MMVGAFVWHERRIRARGSAAWGAMVAEEQQPCQAAAGGGEMQTLPAGGGHSHSRTHSGGSSCADPENPSAGAGLRPLPSPTAADADAEAARSPARHERPPLPLPPLEARAFLRLASRTCATSMQPSVVLRFLKLGIPGGFSMAFEAGAFDIVTIFASRLGPAVTAAHSSMLSIATLT